jgi:hypothetical protein
MFEEIIQRIDRKLNQIGQNPHYSRKLDQTFNMALRIESFENSILLEGIGDNMKPRIGKHAKSVSYNNLFTAWNYLSTEGINWSSLSNLGHLVDPKDNPKKSFRTLEVQLGMLHPPPPSDIPYALKHLLDFIDYDKSHPLLKSLELHHEIAKVQPFMDGNKRSARLVQAVYLEQQGYPIPLIEVTDRTEYMGYFRDTLKHRLDLRSTMHDPCLAEVSLDCFILERVEKSVDWLDEELQKHKQYNLCFKANQPQQPHVLKKYLEQYVRKNGGLIQICISRNQKGVICMGIDTSTEKAYLSEALAKASCLRNTKYFLE